MGARKPDAAPQALKLERLPFCRKALRLRIEETAPPPAGNQLTGSEGDAMAITVLLPEK